MTTVDGESLRALCRELIESLPGPLPISESKAVQLVQKNLECGRFERFAKHRSQPRPLSLRDYIGQVLVYLCSEQSRIAALEKGDPTAWNQLRDFLAHRALVTIQQLDRGPEACALAWDFAHDACLVIFEERYPFDVAFEAWATVILRNLILARYTRSKDASDRAGHIDSLDAPRETVAPLGELLADTNSLAPFERVENQELLLEAMSQLPRSAQRQVIEYTFFEGLPDDEIAKRLGKSRQAVWNLRSRALGHLKLLL